MSEQQNVELDKDAVKEAIKEATEEWLDKQFAKFGKWSLTAILSMALAYVFYGWLSLQGWHK